MWRTSSDATPQHNMSTAHGDLRSDRVRSTAMEQYYVQHEEIGDGGSLARVYRATRRTDGYEVALTRLRGVATTPAARHAAETEAAVLLSLQHRNVLPLLEWFIDGTDMCFILPLTVPSSAPFNGTAARLQVTPRHPESAAEVSLPLCAATRGTRRRPGPGPAQSTALLLGLGAAGRGLPTTTVQTQPPTGARSRGIPWAIPVRRLVAPGAG
jgi:hypothetical protein